MVNKYFLIIMVGKTVIVEYIFGALGPLKKYRRQKEQLISLGKSYADELARSLHNPR